MKTFLYDDGLIFPGLRLRLKDMDKTPGTFR